MSTPIYDGGPAFPCPNQTRPQEGMTLRDWFAGQAIGAAHLTWNAGTHDQKMAWSDCHDIDLIECRDMPRGVAFLCGCIADAMLAERAKGAK